MPGWSEALDDMEERLARTERLLSHGEPPPGPFSLPPRLGPLPAELRPRAEQVLSATTKAQQRVEAARSAVLSALRHRPPTGPGPAYVDRRG